MAACASDSAGITGTVSDPSGAVIPGAVVVLRNAGDGSQRTATAGADGGFSFVGLPNGKYDIEVSFAGFATYREADLEVDGDAPLIADVHLALASQAEVVEVISGQERPDLLANNTEGLISSKTMSNVPLNGRSYTDLLALQPGVVPASSAQPNAVVMSGCTTTPPSGDLGCRHLPWVGSGKLPTALW